MCKAVKDSAGVSVWYWLLMFQPLVVVVVQTASLQKAPSQVFPESRRLFPLNIPQQLRPGGADEAAFKTGVFTAEDDSAAAAVVVANGSADLCGFFVF